MLGTLGAQMTGVATVRGYKKLMRFCLPEKKNASDLCGVRTNAVCAHLFKT